MRHGSCAGVALALTCLMAGAGCQAEKPISVVGEVTLDGQPVEGAVVLFIPEAGPTRTAHGVTLADGSFRLTSHQAQEGIPPGDYKVVVTKVAPRDPGEAMAAMRKKMEGRKPGEPAEDEVESLLPKVYGSAATTPLRCRVPAEGKVLLELKSKE